MKKYNAESGEIKKESGEIKENNGIKKINAVARLHSIETLGTLDGPGIRTIFFLHGCALRCQYCHNPDTWAGKHVAEISVAEVVATAVRYKSYYGRDGGVTFSGGEPLLQAEFVCECVEALKVEGINSYIDTAGVDGESAFAAIDACEGVLLDIKHTDPAAYTALCGGNLSDSLATLAHIKQTDKKCVVRQVVVEGINDSTAQLDTLRALAGNIEIELLAYHTLGAHKWQALGLEYPLDAPAMSRERLRELQLYIDKR